MRLSNLEKDTILNAVGDYDPEALVYLFGSRVDDTKKGGDIDILIFSTKISYKDKLVIKANIFKKLEEQKMDLLIAEDTTDPFVRMAMEKSVRLK